MSHSYLVSTPSKLLASHTATIGRLAWLAAWLHIGKGLKQRMGKLKNKQTEGKVPTTIGQVRLSVVGYKGTTDDSTLRGRQRPFESPTSEFYT